MGRRSRKRKSPHGSSATELPKKEPELNQQASEDVSAVAASEEAASDEQPPAEAAVAPAASWRLKEHLGSALALLESRWGLVAALATASVLRAAHLYSFYRSPLASAPILDPQAYDQWAQQIAAGDWLGHKAFWVDPLYAYLLAVVYAVLGHHPLIVRVLQCLAGVATIALTAELGRRASQSRRVGNAAGLVAALYVPMIHAEMQLEKSSIATLICAAALVLLLRGARRDLIVAGVLSGLAVLTRANLLLLVPFAAVWLYYRVPDTESGVSEEKSAKEQRRLRGQRVLVYLAPTIVVLGLVTLRNGVVADAWLPTPVNGGQNLYLGQHRGNETGSYSHPPFVRPDPEHEQSDFQREAEKRTGRTMTPVQVSTFWARAALGEVAEAPAAALRRTLRKIWLVAHQLEVPDNDDVELAAHWSIPLRLPVFWFGQLVPFALLGGVVCWRRAPATRVLTGFLALYALTLVTFFVVGRFRLPLVPSLIVLAVSGIAWCAERGERRAWRPLGYGLAFVVFCLSACFYRPAWLEQLRQGSLAVGYNNLGGQLLREGKEEAAVALYEKAVATKRSSVVGALRTLGDVYLQHRQYDRAETAMLAVLEEKPDSALGKQALVRLYETMAKDPLYESDPAVSQKLARAYQAAGREAEATRSQKSDRSKGDSSRSRSLSEAAREKRKAGQHAEAIALWKEALAASPGDEGVRYELGHVMEQHSSAEEMVAFWAQAVTTDPKPQTSLYFWGIGLARKGDQEGAQAKWREALRVDPAHEMSEYRLCLLWETRRDYSQALAHCDRAVEIFPDYRGAQEVRGRLLDAIGRPEEARRARELAQRSDPNTPKRYLYWGRYLLRQGRPELAVPELEKAIAREPGSTEAAALLQAARSQLDGGVSLEGGQRGSLPSDEAAQLAAKVLLKTVPKGTPAWIVATSVDPLAAQRAEALASVLREAGWTIKSQSATPIRVKAGVYLFAAESTAPDYVEVLRNALERLGLQPSLRTGYRSYYEEQTRANPRFQGFALEPGQSFVLVFGRQQ